MRSEVDVGRLERGGRVDDPRGDIIREAGAEMALKNVEPLVDEAVVVGNGDVGNVDCPLASLPWLVLADKVQNGDVAAMPSVGGSVAVRIRGSVERSFL